MDLDVMPLMAEFGAAVYDAQVLESGVSLLMALTTKYQGAHFSNRPVNALDSSQVDKTLGELFRLVQEKQYFTHAARKKIQKAIRQRNILVHTFLTDRAKLSLTPSGRAQIVSEIETNRSLLREAGSIVDSLINKYLNEYGTSIEEIKKFQSQYWISDSEPGSQPLQ